jgi:hypothetical protein
MIQFA